MREEKDLRSEDEEDSSSLLEEGVLGSVGERGGSGSWIVGMGGEVCERCSVRVLWGVGVGAGILGPPHPASLEAAAGIDSHTHPPRHSLHSTPDLPTTSSSSST